MGFSGQYHINCDITSVINCPITMEGKCVGVITDYNLDIKYIDVM